MEGLKNKSYLPLVTLFSAPAFAEAGKATVTDAAGLANQLSGQIYSFANLITVVMMVMGVYCLYQIVMTFMNREDERAYPMKNLPMYFIGAAIGLGSTFASDLMQTTIFGGTNAENNQAADVFKITAAKGGAKSE